MSILRGVLSMGLVLLGIFLIAQGVGFQFWHWRLDITLVTVTFIICGLLLISVALEYVTRP